MEPRGQSIDGYITVAALLFIAVFAALVASTLSAARPTAGYLMLGAHELQADALVDGGMDFAAYALFHARQDPATVDGTELRLGEGVVKIVARDEASRVDLNNADANLLSGLFTAAGGRSLRPEVFAARVIDWRDSDEDPLPGGAETAAYLAAGINNGPANSAFRTTGELRYLIGLTGSDIQKLEPFVTVFNPEGGIDPFDAPGTVLRAIPDLRPADVGQLLALRRSGPTSRQVLLDLLSSPSAYLATEPSGIYRLRLTGQLSNGFTSSAEAVISKTEDPQRDYGIIYWVRRGS